MARLETRATLREWFDRPIPERRFAIPVVLPSAVRGSKNCAWALGSTDTEPQTYGHPGSDERVVRPTQPLSDG